MRIGSCNHPPWDNFLDMYQWKVKFISEILGNAGVNLLRAELIVHLHYYSVCNYMTTQSIHLERLPGRFKLGIFRIRLLIFFHWLKEQLALEKGYYGAGPTWGRGLV